MMLLRMRMFLTDSTLLAHAMCINTGMSETGALHYTTMSIKHVAVQPATCNAE